MAFDPDQFMIETLASLATGLLGASLFAWLTGLYKIKAELTARTEMLDKILDEVRATAKAKELSTIAARAEAISDLVNEVAQGSKASEGAKIAARLEKLDQIVSEVRVVTETQKRIETSVAGGEWDRQWRLSQIREAYGRLMSAVYGLQDYFHASAGYAGFDDIPASDRELYRKVAAEFKTAAALTRIFAGGRATFHLDEYERGVQKRIRMTESQQADEALKQLAKLHTELLAAAREELNV